MATLTQPTQRRGKSVHSVNVNYDAVPVHAPSRSPSPTLSKHHLARSGGSPANGGGGGDLSLKGINEDGRRSPVPGDVYGYPSSKVGLVRRAMQVAASVCAKVVGASCSWFRRRGSLRHTWRVTPRRMLRAYTITSSSLCMEELPCSAPSCASG